MARIGHGNVGLTISSEFPAKCRREDSNPVTSATTPSRPRVPDRWIPHGRTRLNRMPVRSDPPDLNPMDQLQRYRFAGLFAKEPLLFTRINPQS